MTRLVNEVRSSAGVGFWLTIAAAIVLAFPASAQISIPSVGTPVTEDFNTLAAAGTSSTTPAGWAFVEGGSAANTTYSAGTGSGTTGDTYSFGSAAADRAFGGLQSGTLIPTVGASFKNDTGAVLGSLDIAYFGEQWRCGTTGRGADRIDFQYSLDATSLTSGTWFDANGLDFNSPSVAAVGALDGNLAANRSAIASTISGLTIPPGAVFWIRWADFNASGADDGLAVDDFSLLGNEPPVANQPTTLSRIKAKYR